MKENEMVRMHTTRSWDFLGLSMGVDIKQEQQPNELLAAANHGDGMIIGVIDTGGWLVQPKVNAINCVGGLPPLRLSFISFQVFGLSHRASLMMAMDPLLQDGRELAKPVPTSVPTIAIESSSVRGGMLALTSTGDFSKVTSCLPGILMATAPTQPPQPVATSSTTPASSDWQLERLVVARLAPG